MQRTFSTLEPRGRPVATGRLVVMMLLPIPALLMAPVIPAVVPVVFAIDVLLLLLAALDYRSARAHPMEVGRALPSRLSVGVANKVRLTVRNRSGRGLRLRLWDHLPSGIEVSEPVPVMGQASTPEDAKVSDSSGSGAGSDVISLSVPAFSSATETVRLTPSSRGSYRFGDIHARVIGPLGLAAADRKAKASEAAAKVYPDLRGAGRLLLSGGTRDLVSMGVRTVRRDGEGSELSALREYDLGDSYRDIDWKATARRDRPIVRAREPERSQTVLICVDAGRLMAARTEGLSKLDHAVNAALLLAFVALRCDDRVGLLLFADEVISWVPPGKGRLQYGRILEALYSAEASLTYVDYRELVRTVLARQSRRALVVTLTDLHDEAHSRPLVEQMKRLAARHLPVVVALRDPALEATARREPTSPEDPWRMTVATELLNERASLSRGLSTAGARILDRLPDEATVSAVNAYVEIKRRQAL